MMWWQRGIVRRAAGLLVALLMAGAVTTVLTGPAQAAVPNDWGFAFVGTPSVASVPVLSHQAGSWPSPFHVHVTPGLVGQAFVTFPRIAVRGGVVHVTAVTDGRPIWCQAQKWGPSGVNEVVAVRCYQPGGVPVFAPFVVLFTQSSVNLLPASRGYGYVHYQPGPGIVATFNSRHLANTVTHLATGVWRAVLPGLLTTGLAGNVQVTAVNATKAAKCEVAGWTATSHGQVFAVRCYGGGTAPLNTGWTLSYQRRRAITGTQPKLFGYTFDNLPLAAGPYMPSPAGVNFSSVPGPGNTIRNVGTGERLVVFPRIGVLPNTVLVTPFKSGPGFCNLITLWGTAAGSVTVRDVSCFAASGLPAKTASLITATSSH